MWNCKCDCGNAIIVPSKRLRNGMTKSCGCLKDGIELPFSPIPKKCLRSDNNVPKNDLTGQRFGRLTVLGIDKTWNGKGVRYQCVCDCGNIVKTKAHNLLCGDTQSCGCITLDRLRTSPPRETHGATKGGNLERLFVIWCGMRHRCEKEYASRYKRYGGRGIKVCDEWHDYLKFKDWALKNGYDDTLSIDRIDINGNYEPSNCRWATSKEQANNRGSNKTIEYNGETKTVSEWADIVGISKQLLYRRFKNGWTPNRALTEQPSNQYDYEPRKG